MFPKYEVCCARNQHCGMGMSKTYVRVIPSSWGLRIRRTKSFTKANHLHDSWATQPFHQDSYFLRYTILNGYLNLMEGVAEYSRIRSPWNLRRFSWRNLWRPFQNFQHFPQGAVPSLLSYNSESIISMVWWESVKNEPSGRINMISCRSLSPAIWTNKRHC